MREDKAIKVISVTIGYSIIRMDAERKFDAFITHDWGRFKSGEEKEEISNHDRVSRIYHSLSRLELSCWFDVKELDAVIPDEMCRGIDSSTIVLVALTRRYLQKVAGHDMMDNCKKEFLYADQRKGGQKMVGIVMEPGADAALGGDAVRSRPSDVGLLALCVAISSSFHLFKTSAVRMRLSVLERHYCSCLASLTFPNSRFHA